mgnify:CR=1 FL=1
MKLTIACVNYGDYLGMGDRYVDALRRSVSRHLSRPYEFVCLKDEGDWPGWWSKIELFRPGRFKGRVVFFDLDGVVTGNLDRFVENKGIIDLADWGWTTHTLCSTVMVWDGDEHRRIFDDFDWAVPQLYRGDQDWITAIGGWQILPKGFCCSYRYHAVRGIPRDCVHVSMHGRPKPHEITEGWVPATWDK